MQIAGLSVWYNSRAFLCVICMCCFFHIRIFVYHIFDILSSQNTGDIISNTLYSWITWKRLHIYVIEHIRLLTYLLTYIRFLKLSYSCIFVCCVWCMKQFFSAVLYCTEYISVDWWKWKIEGVGMHLKGEQWRVCRIDERSARNVQKLVIYPLSQWCAEIRGSRT